MVNTILSNTKEQMGKVIDNLKEGFAGISAGRANTQFFAKVSVDYYGAPTPLQQLATLQIPEAKIAIISPHDKTQINSVEKAINDANLGVSVNNEGTQLRIIFPDMTEDRRNEYIKLAKQKAEDAKIQIRGARHKAKSEIDAKAKSKEDSTSEDDQKRGEKELDKQTKEFTDQIDSLFEAKSKDLATV